MIREVLRGAAIGAVCLGGAWVAIMAGWLLVVWTVAEPGWLGAVAYLAGWGALFGAMVVASERVTWEPAVRCLRAFGLRE